MGHRHAAATPPCLSAERSIGAAYPFLPRFAVSPDSPIFQPDGEGKTLLSIILSIVCASVATILGFLFLLYRNAIMRKLTTPCVTAHRAYVAGRARVTNRPLQPVAADSARTQPMLTRSPTIGSMDRRLSGTGRYAPSAAQPSSPPMSRRESRDDNSLTRPKKSNGLEWSSPKRTTPM